jgi:hypothetical protein
MKWMHISRQLPPNGVVVMTKIDESGKVRNEQELKRVNNLWWIPDGSMYVYYTPTHWRFEENKQV